MQKIYCYLLPYSRSSDDDEKPVLDEKNDLNWSGRAYGSTSNHTSKTFAV
jgi:hypothetical protein